MKRYFFLMVIATLLIQARVSAQDGPVRISGTVIDSETAIPVAAANKLGPRTRKNRPKD